MMPASAETAASATPARAGQPGTGRAVETNVIHTGDALAVLKTLPDCSVNCVVTSPPYWSLKDYGHEGQIGLEKSPAEYIARLVDVFAEVRRVLRDDGVLFLNIADTYGPNKSLTGIPWRLVFGLQDIGWLTRAEIIWHKPAGFTAYAPDRPTPMHEFVFMLTRSPHYYYDADAITEPAIYAGKRKNAPKGSFNGKHGSNAFRAIRDTRHARSVWTIPVEPSSIPHFAMMPTELARRCIVAGCPTGGVVLDPFAGTGTTLRVARGEDRRYLGIELNPAYAAIAERETEGPYTRPANPSVPYTLPMLGLFESEAG